MSGVAKPVVMAGRRERRRYVAEREHLIRSAGGSAATRTAAQVPRGSAAPRADPGGPRNGRIADLRGTIGPIPDVVRVVQTGHLDREPVSPGDKRRSSGNRDREARPGGPVGGDDPKLAEELRVRQVARVRVDPDVDAGDRSRAEVVAARDVDPADRPALCRGDREVIGDLRGGGAVRVRLREEPASIASAVLVVEHGGATDRGRDAACDCGAGQRRREHLLPKHLSSR